MNEARRKQIEELFTTILITDTLRHTPLDKGRVLHAQHVPLCLFQWVARNILGSVSSPWW